jgi:molecular chaperone GrpE
MPDPDIGTGQESEAVADPAEGTAAIGSASVADVEKDLEAALAKAAENYDLYVRAKAETENVRRRTAEDVSKAHKFAIESFAESLVPVIDSLDKALESAGALPPAIREGIELTHRQLVNAFERGNLKPIDPVGEKFDPHFHQAIATVPAPDGVAANTVVSVLQRGWKIADRVLRPALVTVAQA